MGIFLALAQLPIVVLHAEQMPTPRGNDPRSMEEFRGLALGLFIHWSLDVQYGAVISHSLVGADDDYQTRYFNDLPKTFNPLDYDPARLAELARVCGFKYAGLTRYAVKVGDLPWVRLASRPSVARPDETKAMQVGTESI